MFDTMPYIIDTPTDRYTVIGYTHALEAAEAEAFGQFGGPTFAGYAEIKVIECDTVVARFIRDGLTITRE